LTGEALRSVNLEELVPYGHIFRELEFNDGKLNSTTPIAYDSISRLLGNCSNLRKLTYTGRKSEPNMEFAKTARCWSLLEMLKLSDVVIHQQVQGTDAFTLINRDCKLLRKLELRSCALVEYSLRHVARMEHVRELTLFLCNGLDEGNMAAISTMSLVELTITGFTSEWSGSILQSFVGSNLSQSLETFAVIASRGLEVDDVQVAMALASCRKLSNLSIKWGYDEGGCVFGSSSLEGLEAIAAGCPLLAVVCMRLTLPALHYIGTHFSNLDRCEVQNSCLPDTPTPAGFPPLEELETLYPAVDWSYYDSKTNS
jgi:hypothetical protein